MMKKMTEQRGASILMALLLVLLASVVSAVILTAAVGAARQLRADRQAQRSYLTVSSAAELVRESILADHYERIDATVWNNKGKVESSTTTKHSPDGLLGPWLARGIESGGSCAKTTIFLQVEESDELGKVGLAFSMEAYAVTVELSLADMSEDADDCRMTLQLMGTSNTETGMVSGDNGKTVETTTTTVRWSNASIKKGG